MKIASQIQLTFALVILGVMAAFFGIFFYISHAHIEKIAEASISNDLNRTLEVYARFTLEAEQIAKTLSAYNSFSIYYDMRLEDHMSKKLVFQLSNYEKYRAIIVDQNSNIIASTDKHATDIASNSLISIALQGKTASGFTLSEGGPGKDIPLNLIISAAAPLLNSKKTQTIGAFFVYRDLADIKNIKNVETMFFNEQGKFFIGDSNAFSAETINQIFQRKEEYVEINIEERGKLVKYAPILDNDGTVVAGIGVKADIAPFLVKKELYFSILMISMVVVLLVGYQISKRITRTILRLSEQAMRIANGDYSKKLELPGDETRKLAESFNIMQSSLQDSLEQQQRSVEQIESQNKILAKLVGDQITQKALYIESNAGRTEIKYEGGRTEQVNLSLSDLIHILPDHFIEIGAKYIINSQKIEGFMIDPQQTRKSRKERCLVILKGSRTIYPLRISPNYLDLLKNQLNEEQKNSLEKILS